MMRKILGGIVGYIVVFILIAVSLSVIWTALGAKFAFEDGTTKVTTGWIVLMLIVGFIAALISGWVAALVAKHRGGATALAVIILILGLLLAFLALGVDGAQRAQEVLAGREPASLGPMEASGVAVSPLWVHFANPIIGLLGALLGGSLWARRRKGA